MASLFNCSSLPCGLYFIPNQRSANLRRAALLFLNFKSLRTRVLSSSPDFQSLASFNFASLSTSA